jgi:NitT/TauT family transport system permease protein
MAAELAQQIDNGHANRPLPAAAANQRKRADGLTKVGAVPAGHERDGAVAAQSPLPSTAAGKGRRIKRAVVKAWAISIVFGGLSLLVGVAIWHFATKNSFNWFINFENVPSPLAVWTSFIKHLSGQEFYIHVAVSMERILIGYLLAAFLGIVTGVAMGRSVITRAFVFPYIEILRPIPAVAWIPLAILMWPTEESSIIYITFLGAYFPIVLNTLHGVEQTPEVLVRAASSLGSSRLQVFWHVVIPAALPSIAAGLAIGMGVSWFSLLAGEIISGQYGIGYFTWNAYSLINYPDIVVGMLVIGALGMASTLAIRLLTRPMLAWQSRSR